MRKGLLPVALGIVMLVAVTAWAAPVQRVSLMMRDFGFTPSKITLQAGMPAEITIVNRGKVTHEFMLYGMPKNPASMMGGKMGHEWVEETNYFKGIEATVTGAKVTREHGALFEIRIPAGKSAALRFTPTKKGTFEFGCMIADHYESGQRGTLIVK